MQTPKKLHRSSVALPVFVVACAITLAGINVYFIPAAAFPDYKVVLRERAGSRVFPDPGLLLLAVCLRPVIARRTLDARAGAKCQEAGDCQICIQMELQPLIHRA
jgi:hypothetical protein